MTKPAPLPGSVAPPALALALALALAALAAFAPAASAHGAPPVRGIDVRVLTDDDGLGYGGCVEGACPPGSGGGLDLLALDVREAWLPGGEPAVAFRILFQSEEPAAGGSLALRVGEREFRAETADGAAFVSAGFDRLDGPFDVGDGHPKALDGWVRAADLGGPGAALSLTVASFRGEAQDDAMPGAWFANGVEVPPLSAEPAEPGSYTLAGPASLVSLTVEETAASAHGPAKVKLVLSNAVGLPQFANLNVSAPAGVKARVDSAGLALAANGTRTVELTIADAAANGTVEVVATTDLGGRAVASVPFQASSHMGNSSAENHTAHDHASSAPAKESPGPGALLVPAVAAAAVLPRRRR